MKIIIPNFETLKLGITIGLVVAVYVVWYVIDAPEGFDPT